MKIIYNSFTKVQLYHYQGITNKKPIYCLCKKKDRCFYQCLYSNNFIKLDSFYDQRIEEVMLSESIQGFRTKDIYIQQKATFVIYKRDYQRAQLHVAQYFFLQFFVIQVRWSVTPIGFMSNKFLLLFSVNHSNQTPELKESANHLTKNYRKITRKKMSRKIADI